MNHRSIGLMNVPTVVFSMPFNRFKSEASKAIAG